MSQLEMFDGLRRVFIYVGYPAVIVAAFVVIAVRMRALFADYRADRLVQWRLAVAGLLPVTVLTFVVVGGYPAAASWLPLADRWELQLPLGALLAIATLEASQHVSGTRQALSFMLYLSTLGTGLLYVVMEGELARFQPAVFAIVLAGGLHFVFREPDRAAGDSWQPPEQEVEDAPAEQPDDARHLRDRFAALRRMEERIGRR
jgi:hypothetical protein